MKYVYIGVFYIIPCQRTTRLRSTRTTFGADLSNGWFWCVTNCRLYTPARCRNGNLHLTCTSRNTTETTVGHFDHRYGARQKCGVYIARNNRIFVGIAINNTCFSGRIVFTRRSASESTLRTSIRSDEIARSGNWIGSKPEWTTQNAATVTVDYLTSSVKSLVFNNNYGGYFWF